VQNKSHGVRLQQICFLYQTIISIKVYEGNTPK